MKIFNTFNDWHMGDNLNSLNYLRKVAGLKNNYLFRHYCKSIYLNQLMPLVSDIDNLELCSIESKPVDSFDLWIGRDNYYFESPLRYDWVSFHINFFGHTSKILGIESPIETKFDLLFDYPELNKKSKIPGSFDFLIVNSQPLSGQIFDFNSEYFENLTFNLLKKGYKVVTTNPTGIIQSTLEMGFDITDIGVLSNNVTGIIGVPNGPIWPTFNKFNLNSVKFRLIWLSNEKLNLTDDSICFKTCSELTLSLKNAGII